MERGRRTFTNWEARKHLSGFPESTNLCGRKTRRVERRVIRLPICFYKTWDQVKATSQSHPTLYGNNSERNVKAHVTETYVCGLWDTTRSQKQKGIFSLAEKKNVWIDGLSQKVNFSAAVLTMSKPKIDHSTEFKICKGCQVIIPRTYQHQHKWEKQRFCKKCRLINYKLALKGIYEHNAD